MPVHLRESETSTIAASDRQGREELNAPPALGLLLSTPATGSRPIYWMRWVMLPLLLALWLPSPL
jgi:hypothetical protein